MLIQYLPEVARHSVMIFPRASSTRTTERVWVCTLLAWLRVALPQKLGESPLLPHVRTLRADSEGQGPLLVFSDIDDTICRKGHGKRFDDSSYDDEFYPGVLQFMLELARGREESMRPARIILITARAKELARFGIMKITLKHRIAVAAAEVGERNGFPDWGVDVENSLYGRLIDMIHPNKLQRYAVIKYNSWKDFRTTLKTVWMGDNGQGDQLAAESMARHSAKEDRDQHLAAAFIHQVDRKKSHSYETYPRAEETVHLFRTYAEAARIAEERALISTAGLARVRDAVRGSAIYMLCEMKEAFIGGLYPCVDINGNFRDQTTDQLVAGLENLPNDGTAVVPKCSGKAMDKFIDRNGRCEKVLADVGNDGAEEDLCEVHGLDQAHCEDMNPNCIWDGSHCWSAIGKRALSSHYIIREEFGGRTRAPEPRHMQQVRASAHLRVHQPPLQYGTSAAAWKLSMTFPQLNRVGAAYRLRSIPILAQAYPDFSSSMLVIALLIGALFGSSILAVAASPRGQLQSATIHLEPLLGAVAARCSLGPSSELLSSSCLGGT